MVPNYQTMGEGVRLLDMRVRRVKPTTTVQRLFISPVISSFSVLRKEVGEDEGFARIKCRLVNEDIFEFAEYIEIEQDKIIVTTYSYHWQTPGGELIKRWDNVKHHKELASFPAHLHLSEKKVIKSNPMNLEKVLKLLERRILTVL